MKIQITQDDIDKAEPSDCKNCPIYRAVAPLLPKPDGYGHYSLSVHGGYILITLPRGGQVTVNLPIAAREFMAKFDHGEHVDPVELDLCLEGYCDGFQDEQHGRIIR